MPGHPDRAVGCAGGAGAVRAEAGPVPPQADPDEGRRPGRPRPTSSRRSAASRWSTRRPRGSWPCSPTSSRRCAARTAPTERFDPRKAGVAEIGNPKKGQEVRERTSHEQGRGLRGRLVGDGVLDRARRRRQRRHHLGAARGGRRGDQRRAGERGVPPRHRAPAFGLGHPRRREGRARRRHRRTRDAVADPARQPHRLGAAPRRRRGARLVDEGRRARHPQPDERGDRRRSPAPVRIGSR